MGDHKLEQPNWKLAVQTEEYSPSRGRLWVQLLASVRKDLPEELV
jgi:hypothetical protein